MNIFSIYLHHGNQNIIWEFLSMHPVAATWDSCDTDIILMYAAINQDELKSKLTQVEPQVKLNTVGSITGFVTKA